MNFFFDFFWSSVSRIVPTNVKGGIWEFLNIHSLEKWEKNEGGPSGDIKKICEKSLTKPKTNLHKKNFGHGGTRTHVILLVRPRKSRSGQVAVK